MSTSSHGCPVRAHECIKCFLLVCEVHVDNHNTMFPRQQGFLHHDMYSYGRFWNAIISTMISLTKLVLDFCIELSNIVHDKKKCHYGLRR